MYSLRDASQMHVVKIVQSSETWIFVARSKLIPPLKWSRIIESFRNEEMVKVFDVPSINFWSNLKADLARQGPSA